MEFKTFFFSGLSDVTVTPFWIFLSLTQEITKFDWLISCLNLTSLFALFVFLICNLKN
jgi:hypothetical protein